MSLMGKATEKGLETVAKAVLGPAFHDGEMSPKKVFNPILAFLCHSIFLENIGAIWDSRAVTVLWASPRKNILRRAFGANIGTECLILNIALTALLTAFHSP